MPPLSSNQLGNTCSETEYNRFQATPIAEIPTRSLSTQSAEGRNRIRTAPAPSPFELKGRASTESVLPQHPRLPTSDRTDTGARRDREMVTWETILAQIETQSRKQFTGRLDIRNLRGRAWVFYFGMGRLLWASENKYPRRRWRRQYFLQAGTGEFDAYPNEQLVRAGDRYECWDYHLLMTLSAREQLTAEQVQQLAAETIVEVLFDLFQEGLALFPDLRPDLAGGGDNWERFTVSWRERIRPSDRLAMPLSWSSETPTLVATALEQCLSWQQIGLGNFSPHLAPDWTHRKNKSQQLFGIASILRRLIDGDRSLYDLAALTGEELTRVGQMLLPELRAGTLALHAIADLPLPEAPAPKPLPTVSSASDRRRTETPASFSPRWVAYIDDSPQCQGIVKSILAEGSYRCLSIEDPMLALPLLLEHSPDLILLDLIMPSINGYELCSMIQQVSQLRETPVVFVTGQDSLVDRVRAKMAGASGFISKPIERRALLMAAQRFARHPG